MSDAPKEDMGKRTYYSNDPLYIDGQFYRVVIVGNNVDFFLKKN